MAIVAAYIVAMEGATPGYLVWRVSMRWRAAADRALAPLGLTHAQYALLATLYGMALAGDQPSQRRLADEAGLEPIFVSKLVRTLERGGLLERAAHPDDTRAYALTLTERGTDVIVRAVATIHALQDELTAPIGGAGSPRTRALKRSLRAILDDGNSPMPDTPPPLTGQDINIAAAATRSLLDVQLERAGLTFPQYLVLRGLTAQGPASPAGLSALLAPLPGPRTDVVAELTAKALVRPAAPDSVELTPQGEELFQRLTRATDEVAAAVYGDLDPGELEVARRVLAEVTQRAQRIRETI